MKYTLHVNQIAAHGIGIQDKIDLIDLCIFDAFKSFANSARCEKMIDDNGIWFWISYAEIIREIPLANIKTNDGIYRRMLKLRDAGLIVFHPNNQKKTKTFFQWGKNYDAMERTDWEERPTDEKPKVLKDLRMKNRSTYGQKTGAPTDEKPYNQTTINQTTKTKRDSTPAENLNNLEAEKKERGLVAPPAEAADPTHMVTEVGPESPHTRVVSAFTIPTRVDTVDEAEEIIMKWASADGRESVRKWYADAARNCTANDVKEMVAKFAGVYLTIGDEGKRQRMAQDPLQFFKYTFKTFLKNEKTYGARAMPGASGQASPSALPLALQKMVGK